jgi:hypothetical protein
MFSKETIGKLPIEFVYKSHIIKYYFVNDKKKVWFNMIENAMRAVGVCV